MKVGINGAVHDFSDMRVGINGAVRQASELWIGVNGAAKKVWPSYKPVVLDTESSFQLTTYDAFDKCFTVDENGWGFDETSMGWYKYYYFKNGPIYSYYNLVLNYSVEQAEGKAFNIKGDKFELIGAQRKVFTDSDYYGALTGDVSRYGLPIIATDGSLQTISGWVGLSTKDENRFDTIYSFSYSINSWYGDYQIGFGISTPYVGGVMQPGIALGCLRESEDGTSRTYSCNKIGLQQG